MFTYFVCRQDITYRYISIFGNTDTSYISVRYVISYSEILVIEYHPPAGAGVSVTAVDAGLRMQNIADFSGKGPYIRNPKPYTRNPKP